jgi:hypothetical protein
MLKNMDSRDLMSTVAGMASLLTHGVRVHVADASPHGFWGHVVGVHGEAVTVNHGYDCPQCQDNHNCRIHWQYLVKYEGTRVSLQCPTCAHLWTVDAIADETLDGHGQQTAEAAVATISLGGGAGEVATSPDGNHVYVMMADSIKVVSQLHHVVATYPTGPHPKNMLVSADGTRIYVTGYDGSMSIIRTADNTVKTASVGALPRATDFSADGKHAYTVDFAQQSIRAIDTADNSVAGSVQLWGHPEALAVSANGEFIYVTDYLKGTLTVISAALVRPRAEGT